MIGKTLVHYEITAEIGRGGMGEVYQAKDMKLGRDVAIKVLPEEFALDHDRVARFQREAKLLASLNHPNIAAIYGLEESEGTHFLVMELIEGDTLRDRIKSGPIPVEEALKLALQMAEALEAAHEKGVIHRDLKPANIKVTPDGKVKILDFGLAKAYTGDQENVSPMDSPTISAAATQQGVILGTAAYMSPEQARGKPVDKRADIWAFGCVLFEMLTGQTAFQGEDVSETLASVIKGDSNLGLLPANIHPRVREVITRCLQKEQRKRYGRIGEAQYEIEQALSDPSGILVEPVTTVKPKKKLRLGIPWVAAITILGIIIAGAVVWFLKPTESHHVMRFYHELPEDQAFTGSVTSLVDLSPDGTKIAYVANQLLYLRKLNELTARPIRGTDENPITPFFSPDGLSVGYFSLVDNQWKRITVSGGAPVTICDAGLPHGATWGSDDAILFVEDAGIMHVSANGGTPELLIEAKQNERFFRPQMLAGGEWVLFTIRSEDSISWDEAQIVVQSLETEERKILVTGGSDARYVPTGHLVYALGDVLYAKVFDSDRMEVKGGAVSMVEGVRRASITGSANYGFSEKGMLVHVVGGTDVDLRRNMVWVERNGKEDPLGAESRSYRHPRISPDGTKVAVTIDKGDKCDIYIWDLVNKNMPRLTFNEDSSDPLWTLDGKRIVFMSGRNNLYWRAADGTGDDELLGSGRGQVTVPNSWSIDGKILVTYEYLGGGSLYNIGSLSMEDEHIYKPLLQEEYTEMQPKVSPDGKWMAYMSDASGQREIYVRAFPDVDSGGRWQVSNNGGISPLWSRDGKELFYRSGDATMVVQVETDPIFKPENPKVLFSGRYYTLPDIPGILLAQTPWDIHPDGTRFIMFKELEPIVGEDEEESTTPIPQKIIIVTNWVEELKQRAPVD